jgi:hypothetical protein
MGLRTYISQKAVTTSATIANGVRTFQHRYMSWSTRKRGNVQRTHICTKMKKKPLIRIQNTPQMGPFVHSFNKRGPRLGSGEFQPPKKSVEIITLTMNMLAYSAKKIMANFIPPYSVKYPDTNSDSASGISNGARLHSASEAMK